MSNQLDKLIRTRLPAQHRAKDLGLLSKIGSELGNSAKKAANDIQSIAKDVDEILRNDLGIHSDDWKKAGTAFVRSAKNVRGVVNKGLLYINDTLGILCDFVASKDNGWEDKRKEIVLFSKGLEKSISDSSIPSVEHEFVESCEVIIALCRQYRKPPWPASVRSKAKEIEGKCSNLITKPSLAEDPAAGIIKASIGLASESTRREMITFIQENTSGVAYFSNQGSPEERSDVVDILKFLNRAQNILYNDLNDIAKRFNNRMGNEKEMYEHQFLFVLGLYGHFAKILQEFGSECVIEKKSSRGFFSFLKKFLPFKS